jgi:hypothetical protein
MMDNVLSCNRIGHKINWKIESDKIIKVNKIMKDKLPLSPAGKLMVTGLITAAAGVTIQIISGHHYPKVPPVFFILLIPAGLVAFGRWRWASIIVTLAGLFLVLGLFGSGAYVRLFSTVNFGDFVGLWIQTIGDVIAAIAGIMAIIQNYFIRSVRQQ